MNTTDTTLRNHSSNTLMLLYSLPILLTAKANSHAKIITGNPVATAKTTGRYNPLALVTVIGMSIAKYNTPL